MTIKEAIKNSGTTNPFAMESAKVAEETLSSKEKLLYAVNANTLIIPADKMPKRKIGRLFFIQNCLNGVVAITDKRVFYCNSSKGNSIMKEIPLYDIQTVEDKFSILFSVGNIRLISTKYIVILELKSKAYKGFKEAIYKVKKISNP